MCMIFAPHGVPGWAPTVTTNNTTEIDPLASIPDRVEDLEVVETVEIEREFDANGNVIKEKRTVSKPRVIPRDLPPRTPLRPDKPWRDVGDPNTPYEPYKAPQGPYTKPWPNYPWNPAPTTPSGPYWIGDPPGQSPNIWCGSTTPAQQTYTVTYNTSDYGRDPLYGRIH